MVFIIAEAGVNHGGSLDEAYRLVDAAYFADADAVKFQAFTPERLDPPGPRREMLRGLALSRDDFACLLTYSEQAGLEFMATPFDVAWLEFFVDLGVTRIKVSSSSIDDRDLLLAIRRTDLPVILSTGLAQESSLVEAFRILNFWKVTLLHCVSVYPTQIADVNLRRMTKLRLYGTDVGLSDHSTSIYPPIAATVLGATVIEKHLTLSRYASGPDHASSLEPNEFRSMVLGIRETERAMGSKELFPKLPTDALELKQERDTWRNLLSVMADTPAA